MPSDRPGSDKIFQAIYIPEQKPVADVSEDMKVALQSYPPLGQATPVATGEVIFTVVLDVPQFREREPWEVSLWGSTDDDSWDEVKLSLLGAENAPATLQLLPEGMSRFYFSAHVTFKESFKFTLKFRHCDREPWRWIRDEQGLNDGIVTAYSPSPASEQLSDYITNLNKEWTVAERLSQSPQSRLWSLESSIPPADGDVPTYKDIEIGTPWGSFLRYNHCP
jgi:hypothetical protein